MWLIAVEHQQTFLSRPEGDIVPSAIARMDEFKFVTILIHRGKSLSVEERTKLNEIAGHTDRRSNHTARWRNL